MVSIQETVTERLLLPLFEIYCQIAIFLQFASTEFTSVFMYYVILGKVNVFIAAFESSSIPLSIKSVAFGQL